MKIKIIIDCEDERELLNHLSVIRTEVKKEIKKQKGEITKRARIYDSNCYGDHLVRITPEN